MTSITESRSLRRRFRRGMALFVLCLSAAATTTFASEDGARDAAVMSTASFLAHHPDLRYRLLGRQAYDAGNHGRAMKAFLQAARYADKPSQGLIAEMTWHGEGVPVDHARAQAWMALAAERGYPVMVASRDAMWAALDAGERVRAQSLSVTLRSEYGDAVAQPRLERLLRQALREVTGSRTGSVGAVTMILPSRSGTMTLDGSQFFQDKFWKPEQYWRWQGSDWLPEPRGRVDVGAPTPVEPAVPAKR